METDDNVLGYGDARIQGAQRTKTCSSLEARVKITDSMTAVWSADSLLFSLGGNPVGRVTYSVTTDSVAPIAAFARCFYFLVTVTVVT